jgi:single-strand DNA-binding protein
MMAASIYGRLGSDPRAIPTKTGKPMTVVSIAVDIGADDPEWLQLVCFGTNAEALARHAKGDLIWASGRVERNCYTNRSGGERCQLKLVCDTIVSARTVRPSGGKKRQPEDRGDPRETSMQRPLDPDYEPRRHAVGSAS